MQKRVYVYTYGCQMNHHDSEKMLGILGTKGYAPACRPEDADLIIFNTCAIREKAAQKFYSQLGRTKAIKLRQPDLRIVVAGCVAQHEKAILLRRAPFVDRVIGPQNIHRIDEHILDDRRLFTEGNPDIAGEAYEAARASGTRAWITIMYGCNNYCAYCIVPYTRGREISRPGGAIVSEARSLRDSGYKEITLLGQNVNSYRSDVGFSELLRRLGSLGIPRIRFVTSHPRDLSPDVIGAMAELPAVCEHIHLPLQSGSDRVLQGMNRRYRYADYQEKVRMLRNAIPGVAITTDIIAGFPGETAEDHRETVRALEEIQFDGVFAFKFSARTGTRAFDMDGHVPAEVKAERLGEILRLQEGITLQKNQALVGSVAEILVEGPSETDVRLLAGRTRTNKIVTIPDRGEREGEFVTVRIERARQHSLDGLVIAAEASD